MLFSLEDIFDQSLNDRYSASINNRGCQSMILYGIKSVRDLKTEVIKIYDTTKGGDFYKEIIEDEYNIFFEQGWRYGVYVLCLNNIRLKLKAVEAGIKKEVNGRMSNRKILLWKTRRFKLMAQYSEITKKLNQLKLNKNGKSKITNDI
tara:strand:+ start:63 stop:506 length:444 start_codon:yes stop_codon:yes gene_type:complete